MELEKFDVRFRELGGGHGKLKCDHHIYGTDYVLDTWYTVLIFITPIGRLLHADCVLKRCCHYTPNLADFPLLHSSEEGSMNLFPETVRPGRPLRIQIMTASFLVFHMGWSVAGIYWCCQDDACRDVNPNLAFSVGVMCVVMLVYVTLSQLSHLHLARLVRLVTQEDAERAQAVAAARLAGCVNIELDSTGQVDGEDIPSDCPICMDTLLADVPPSEGNQLVPEVCKTPCGHIFHAPCLQNWACRSGSCPLCRSDLSILGGGAATRLDGPHSEELRALLAHLERHSPAQADVTRSILGRRGP